MPGLTAVQGDGPIVLSEYDDTKFETEDPVFLADEVDRMKGREASPGLDDDTQAQRLCVLVDDFSEIFATSLAGRRAVDWSPMEVKLKADVHPVQARPRSYTPGQTVFLRSNCRALQRACFVKPVSSAVWIFVLFVKKFGTVHFLMSLDLRAVNHAMLKDERHMPNFDAMLAGIGR